MNVRAAALGVTALAGLAFWPPATSAALHQAVPQARAPTLTMPWPAYYYWRYNRDDPRMRRWLLPCAGAGAVASFAPFGLLGLALAQTDSGRRPLRTARPGEDVPEVPRARSRLYGKARWLTDREAKRRSKRARHGCVVIGKAKDGTLLTDSLTKRAGHMPVIGGSGTGKSASITVPTLVPDIGWCGPVLVFDPAGEVWYMTRDVREAAGQRVYRIGLPHMDDDGTMRPCHGFNALDWIDIHSPTAGADVEEVVEMIGKEKRQNASESPIWRASGKTIQKAILLDMLWDAKLPQSEKTLATFARRVSLPKRELLNLLEAIHAESASERARIGAGAVKDDPDRMFAGYQRDAQTDVEWLLEPAYAHMVCASDMRSDELARGDVAVYVEIPMAILQSTPEVGRTIIHALLKGIYRHNGRVANDILGIVEDVNLLGRMKVLEDARDNARKYRFHLMPVWQSMGQIADTWGIGGKSSWFNSSTGQIFLGIQDDHAMKEVAERCGSYTGLARTENRSSAGGGGAGLGSSGNRSRSDGLSLVKVPLIHPEEVRELEGRIVFRGKDPALKCGDPFWWERPEMVGRIKDSPFRRLDAA